jgi:predicted dehydrogenase
MGIRIGICGTGVFAKTFIRLFKQHPRVDKVVLCDLVPEKLAHASRQFEIQHTCPSLDELCTRDDVDAVALFTQNDRHAPQAVQALRAGKHVYSAVPSAISMPEIRELVQTVEQTKLIYQIGETSYYYACAVYCRDRFRKGDFGRIVYGEGEYYHDLSHGMEQVAKTRFGADWMRHIGMPPFFYPTHSTSMIVSVTAAHAVKVCGMGVNYFREPGAPDYFNVTDSVYKNPFANEVMLCQMSDGSVARFNEFRQVAYSGRRGMVGLRLYGTKGSFEDQVGNSMWLSLDHRQNRDITKLLDCAPAAPLEGWERAEAAKHGLGEEAFSGTSPVHHVEDLPKEFQGMPNGHEGAHQFLVHEFVTAVADRRQPPNNVWQAARYLVPGLIAHESALNGGVLMDVPDFGDGPRT